MQLQKATLKGLILVGALTMAMSATAKVKVTPPEDGGGGFPGNSIPANDNQDACGAVLCLAGSAMEGKSPSACTPYIRKYFEIHVTKHGVFRPDKTAEARANFLKQCKSSNGQTRDLIQNAYGSSGATGPTNGGGATGGQGGDRPNDSDRNRQQQRP